MRKLNSQGQMRYFGPSLDGFDGTAHGFGYRTRESYYRGLTGCASSSVTGWFQNSKQDWTRRWNMTAGGRASNSGARVASGNVFNTADDARKAKG